MAPSSYTPAPKSTWQEGGERRGRFPGHQLVHASCVLPKALSEAHGDFGGLLEPERPSARRAWAQPSRQSLPLKGNEEARHS